MTNKCGSCGSLSSTTSKFCTQCGNKIITTTSTTTTSQSFLAPKVPVKPTTTTSTTTSPSKVDKPRPVSTYIPKTTPVTTIKTTTPPKSLPTTPSTTTTTTTTTTKSILKPTPTPSTTNTLKKPLPDPIPPTTNRTKSYTVNYGKESPIKSTPVTTTTSTPSTQDWKPSGSFVKMAAKSRDNLDTKAMRDSMIINGQESNSNVNINNNPKTVTSSKSSLNISHKKAVSSPEPTTSSKSTLSISSAEKQSQLEKQIQLEKEKFQQKEKEIEKQRQSQIEKDKEAEKLKVCAEKEKQLEKEKEKEKEREKQKQSEREKLEKEKQKQIEKDKLKQVEKEKQKQQDKEKEKERIVAQEKQLEKTFEKERKQQEKEKEKQESEREKEREKKRKEFESHQDKEREKEKEREKLQKEKEKLQQKEKEKEKEKEKSDDHNDNTTTVSDQIKNILTTSNDSNGNTNGSTDSPKDKKKTKHGSRFFSFILGDKDDEDDIESLQISSPNPQHSGNSINNGTTSLSRESLDSSNNSINSEVTTDDDTSSQNADGAPLRKWAMKRNELQTSSSSLLPGSPNGSPVISTHSPSAPSLVLGSSRISSPEQPPPLIELPTATDHRSRVIEEVIVTENDYIRDLEIMCWLKREMIQQDESSKLNSLDEINAMFSNVEQLLLVNKELYHTFVDSKYQDHGDAIASGFKMMSAFLKSYSVYCSNQQKALSTYSSLRGKNVSYLAYLLTRRECRSLPFDSFLIKPIQRVCKYPLLIRELIKSTPTQSKSHAMLLDAQSAIEQIVLEVNDKKREFDSQMRMYEIQKRLLEGGQEYKLLSPSRKLIKEGVITSWGFIVPTQTTQFDKKPKEGYYYLFNDLFLYTQIKSGSDDNNSSQPLKLKADIPLNVSLIKDIPEPSNSFELIYSIQQIWMFSLPTPEEKQSLFSEIDNCIEIQLKTEYEKYLKEKQHQQQQQNSPIVTSISQPTLSPQAVSTNTTPTNRIKSSSPGLSSQVESYDEWRKLVRNKPLPSIPPIGSPSINRPPPKVLPPPPSTDIKI